MKGYKAFGKGMVCRGKQYAENAEFTEPVAEICKSGMHFCINPLDCLDYYPLIDDEGNIVEMAEVEAPDDAKTDDGRKYVTTSLKIGKKMKLAEMITAAREVMSDEAKQVGGNEAKQVGGNEAKQVGGDMAQQVGGDWAQQVGGYRAQQVGGENSIHVVGQGGKVKAGMYSIIVMYKYERGRLEDPLVGYIDGVNLLPDVWYEEKNGEIVEVNDDGKV